MPHAAVVYNPTKVDLDELRPTIERTASAAGWDQTRWLETSADDPGFGQAKQAAEGGASVAIAAGGDGTVRAAAQGLRGSQTALGLLPSGTGNLLARNLKLTLDNLEHSVDTAINGINRSIDLGVVVMARPGGRQEEHSFVVMAGMGLDARMIANSDEDLKAKLGVAAYVKSIVQSLRPYHRMRLEYRMDDEPLGRTKIHTLIVGNCGSLQNNIMLLPDAAVDDGRLDVIAIQPEGPAGWLQVLWKVLVENGIRGRVGARLQLPGADSQSRSLNYQQCAQVEVHVREPAEIELDGDAFGEVYAFRATVAHNELLVRMPTDWEPSS